MSRRVFRASRWCVWPAVLSLWFPGLSSAFAADYYVSPTGSDGNPGTFAAPFRTIQKARDVVKTVSAGMTSDIHVYLRGGWYVLASPLTFDPSCSGRNGHNIIYEAYPGEAPVISGGRRISGWALHDAGKNIWKAAAPGLETRQLFVNCVRAVRARKGTGNTSALPGAVKTATGFTTADTSMQSWGNITDVEFVFNGNQGGTATYDQHNGLWVEHRIGVAGINGTVITMKQPAWTTINGNTNHVLRVSVPTDIENAYELLDRPGEFYLNRSQGVLYYIPRSGQDMATAVAVAPVLESLVSGTGILGSPVRNLQFKGITFAHSTWLKPSGNDGFTEHQANACYPTDAFPAAGVAFKTAHEVRVERCVFAHLGGVGLRLYAGSRNCVVDACVFTDISGNGLMLGDVTDPTRSDTRARDIGNRVTNCYVHDSCVEYHGGVGIIALYVADTVIAHNEVAWLPYSGMSLGWGWGRASYMQGNHITANHVHHIMRRMCDGGCIYTLGNMPGSTIDNNWFDDMPTLFNAGAIYTDNGSENITACSNVCSAIGCRWLFVNTRKRVDIHHNYSTTTTQILRPETVAVVSDTTFMSSSSNNWPQAARDIASRAGIQSPHQDIKSLRCGCSAGFPVAPAAPADLTAAAISPYRVDLAWTDRSSNESGFRIDRRQSGTLSWAPVLETAANAAGWSDTSVLAGTKYYYTVLAYNAGGESPSGTVASATTPNGAPPPGCRFTAYNDLAWASGQLANRITTYTRGQAGRLVDNATGANTPVTLTVGTGGGGPYTDQGANAASGTDAYNVFSGKVSCAGLLSYFGGGNLTLRFSGMDPSLFYEVVLFGNRNASSYTNRLTTVTLSGADAFENRSTAGAAVAGPSDSSTVMCNGWNGAAGLVVRYAQVKPGADGEMTLTVADETSRFYVNALMLRATTSSAPSEFTAYNDLAWASGQLANRITTYTRGQAGRLVDNATGANTPVTLTVGTGGGGPYMDQGANAASGTDAYNVFNGKVSCAGLLSYFGGGNLTLRFSEMDPSLFYEVVLFGNRNAASYTDRLTTVTLSGADAFENRSTAGAAVAGPSDSSTVMCNGWNGAAGLVVRYAQVKPGADGEMTLTVADETSRFYLNALMLRTTSEDKTLIPDSTHDGLADDWQTAYFGEPTAPMAAPDLDADGDGMANAQEYVAGTDPSAADSVLDVRLEWANGRMWVSFDTLPAQGGSYDGRTRLYALETSPLDAVNPSWSLVPGYDRITGDGTVVSIPIVGTSSAQYRVRVWLE